MFAGQKAEVFLVLVAEILENDEVLVLFGDNMDFVAFLLLFFIGFVARREREAGVALVKVPCLLEGLLEHSVAVVLLFLGEYEVGD